MYEIIQTVDKFICTGQLQDGIETWKHDTLTDAVHSIINFAKTMNGDYISVKDISISKYPTTKPAEDDIRLTKSEISLLSELRKGTKVALNFNDLRVKYNITDEECEEVLTRRLQRSYEDFNV